MSRPSGACAAACAVALALASACALAPVELPPGVAPLPPRGVEVEGRFGPIAVVQRGHLRQLLFFDEEGDPEIQSELDLAHPDDLVEGYTRTMFASYLAVPAPERVLIVGLGGGAMVRFLRARDPGVEVDVVEIDPVVVELAARYFGVRPEPGLRIQTADALDVLETTEARWDVIYMDAFLHSGEGTDDAGVPLELSAAPFLQSLHRRLTPGGVVVFNLVDQGDSVAERQRAVEAAFGEVWRFDVPLYANVVLVAAPTSLPEGGPREAVGAAVDRRLKGNFSIEALVGEWVE